MLPNRVIPMIQATPAGWLGIDCRAHDAEHVRALIEPHCRRVEEDGGRVRLRRSGERDAAQIGIEQR